MTAIQAEGFIGAYIDNTLDRVFTDSDREFLRKQKAKYIERGFAGAVTLIDMRLEGRYDPFLDTEEDESGRLPYSDN